MEETRKYKQTELGLLPEDWEVVKLGEKVSNPCYGIGAEAISFNGVDKYLRITDISDEGHFAPNPLCSPAFFNEIHIAKENDLFVARTGASVGKTYLYNSKDGRLIFAGFLVKLNITDANSKFVFYYTQTSQYKNWVVSESMRSGQPGLNLKQTMNLSMPLPPIEEQRRIASALTSIDNLIDSLDRLIAKKRDIKQGAMQQLLSGKKRLKGFTEPWKFYKIDDLFDIGNGYTPSKANPTYWSNGTIPWFRMEDIRANGRILKDSIQHITEEAVKDSGLFPANSIILSTTATIGEHALLIADSLANQRFSFLVRKLNRCSDIDIMFFFYHCFILGEWCRANINDGGLMAVNMTDLKNYTFSIPSLPEQQAIASVLTSMDNELSALEAKRKKYEQIKQGMMQQLLTGRIRLENTSTLLSANTL